MLLTKYGCKRKTANQNYYLVALLLISAFSLGLAGCSGVVSGNGSTTPPPTSDTTPPTVSITSPAESATVSGNVNVTATAADNVSVAKVQFKIDGTNTGPSLTGAPYAYTWNTTTFSSGNHSITAVATDGAGNSTTSAAVSVKVDNTVPDTTPPTVSISAPANGSTVSGVVSVTANASDNVSVASVQFQLDGANVGALDVAAPFAYSWSTTTVSNGSHTLRAIAKDAAGNSTTSATVTVTVSNTTTDTTPPTVSVSAPANGAAVSGTVSVTANASDNVGVASVQFQLDGTNVGSLDTTSPYSFSWNTTTASNGSHTLRAIAKDAAGNSTTSANVTVTVNNGAADTTPPSVPTGLGATAASSSQINLSWTASTDNIGVTGYNVFRAGSKIGTSTSTSYQDGGLLASTSYSYTVSAFDAAGNTSAQSTSASATTLASSGGGGIPTTLGWYQIPNTKLQPVCPNAATFGLQGNCAAEMYAWSGATADTTRNRLVIWGGGHVDWWGNEVYALNLNANPIALTRLDNPSNPNGGSCNSGAYGDGNPCARHTYDGLNYHPPTDTVVQFGRSKRPDGSFLISGNRIDIWSLNSSNTTWTKKGSNFGPVSTSYIPMSAYDANSGLIFFHDGQTLWSYNPTTNAFTDVDATGMSIRNGLAYSSFVIDPLHKYGFLMGGSGGGNTGGNLYRYDLSTAAPYNHTDLLASSSGCSAYLGTTSSNSAPGGPGVAWYPVRNVIVMWNGGNSVGIYNPTTNSCTTETYSGGPGAAQVHGTFGRFSYFPALGVFALCNDIAQNCYTLRIDSAGGTGGSGPTISAVAAGSITTSAATIGWTTDVAATSQVEYGTTTAYGTLTSINSTMVTAHSLPVTGLAINTLYHYRVHSKNSSGVESISGDFAFQTSNTSDTTPPTVSITSPAGGAAVSGAVTLSANASDNVGVTSVQFQVDGVNVGSALASSPYSMSWNTTGASNAIHTLTAQARDAAGNVGTAVGVSVTVSNSTSTADQNFQQRCAAAGVLNCQSFDTITVSTLANTAAFTDGFKGGGDPANTNRDTSVFLSGGASQRYTWPQNDNTDNCCKDYIGFFGQGSNNIKFGQNSDFYVQFAFRADATWTTRGWESDGSWPKLFNIHNEPTGTCDDTSLVGVNFRTYNVLQVFTTCGGINLTTCSDGVAWATGCTGEIYSQQGWTEPSPFTGYQCGYNSGSWSGPNCFNFVANTWYTLYFHVHVGTWGSNNSLMEGWIAPYGQQMKRWLTSHNLVLRNGSNTPGFNSIALTQFMTAHSTGNGGSGLNPGTNVWFDELIISSQPIAAPAGQTP